MLVLQRRQGESIVIDGEIVVSILYDHKGRIKVAIQAPSEIPIVRAELLTPTQRKVMEDQGYTFEFNPDERYP